MPEAQLNKRLLFFSIILALFALALVLQYASIMLVPVSGATGRNQHPLERGPILDRNGRILALQTTVYTLSAWPGNIEDPFRTAHLLAPVLDLDEETLTKKLSEGTKAIILRNRLDQGTRDELMAIINRESLPGLALEAESSRTYPEKSSAAQLIGFTGKDNQGLEGLEYRFNEILAFQDQALPDGKAYGHQLVLTIDCVIQQAMEKLADKTRADYAAQAVMLYVLDARSGEFLAYVNRPGYDPNNWQASTAEDRRNLGTSYLYEPGSVFKIFSLAAIMNRGRVGNNTLFMTSNGYRNRLFRDPITDMADYGNITPEGIIVHSSNVGAALASDTVTAGEFHEDLTAFGFGAPTGIEIPGEEKGLLKPQDQWTPRTKPTLSFGQELSVTAMQMLQAATAIANDGTMLKPRIIRQILDAQGKVLRDYGPVTVRNVISPAVARHLRQYMNAATSDSGTGRRSRVEGIDLSVKTGTAQMLDPHQGGYSSKDFIASSLGMFPTEHPRLMVYAVVIKPRGETLGGRIAAPLIKQAAEFLIPYLGISREGDQVLDRQAQIQIHIPTLPVPGDTVPDYTGLPLRTVMELHKDPAFQVVINGSGYVQSQDPPAGTPLEPGMRLSLTLSDQEAPAGADNE